MTNKIPAHNAAERIEAELKELARIADLPSKTETLSAMSPWRDFPGFWQKAKEISDLFRTSDLPHDDRVRLWDQHQELCDRVSKLRARERQLRKDTSRKNRDGVMSIINEARTSLGVALSSDDLVQTRPTLDRALAMIKESFLLHQNRHECWDAWHEVDRAFVARRQELSSKSRKRHDADRTIEERVGFLNDMRRRKAEVRDRLLQQIDELQDGIQKSWKLEWATRARGWIHEKEQKVQEIAREIRDLDRQIKNVRDALRSEGDAVASTNDPRSRH